jgi:hypothetical protein
MIAAVVCAGASRRCHLCWGVATGQIEAGGHDGRDVVAQYRSCKTIKVGGGRE